MVPLKSETVLALWDNFVINKTAFVSCLGESVSYARATFSWIADVEFKQLIYK